MPQVLLAQRDKLYLGDCVACKSSRHWCSTVPGSHFASSSCWHTFWYSLDMLISIQMYYAVFDVVLQQEAHVYFEFLVAITCNTIQFIIQF